MHLRKKLGDKKTHQISIHELILLYNIQMFGDLEDQIKENYEKSSNIEHNIRYYSNADKMANSNSTVVAIRHGYCNKEKHTVQDWKSKVEAIKNDAEELSKKLNDFSEKAMDDEKQYELKDSLVFTGKAIIMMNTKQSASDLADYFSL